MGNRLVVRFAPSLHLVDVTEDAALIGWGGFWLDDRDGRTWVVDDDELPAGGTIGAGSPSYGDAVVEVRRGDRVVATAETADVNHVWVEGLRPDTTYEYLVTVDGRAMGRGRRASAHPPCRGRPRRDFVRRVG